MTKRTTVHSRFQLDVHYGNIDEREVVDFFQKKEDAYTAALNHYRRNYEIDPNAADQYEYHLFDLMARKNMCNHTFWNYVKGQTVHVARIRTP